MDNLMVLLAPVGVLFLVGLTWVLGGNKKAALEDEQAALDRFRQDFFEFDAAEIAVSEGGHHAALLLPASGEGLGIVFAMGDNYATRMLQAGDVAKLSEDGTSMSFKINEFTGRRVDFTCKDQDSAVMWAQRLRALVA